MVLSLKTIQQSVIAALSSIYLFNPFFAKCALADTSSLIPRPVEIRKIVILDAGSSGNRVTSYQFEQRSPGESFKLVQQSPLTVNWVPLNYGQPLPDKLLDALQKHYDLCTATDFADCGVFVGGTAGLRTRSKPVSVGDREMLTSDLVFMQIADDLYHRGVGVDCPGSIRLIDGLEEAAFTWMGANALVGSMESLRDQTGIIELGGGSTQIGFRIEDSLLSRGPDGKTLPVPGRVYHFKRSLHSTIDLYGESHHGYGLNYALSTLERMEDGRVNSCSLGFEQCREAVQGLFTDGFSTIMSNTIPEESKPSTFLLSGFFYCKTVALGLDEQANLITLRKAAQHVCSMSTEEIESRLGNRQPIFETCGQDENIRLSKAAGRASRGLTCFGRASRLCSELTYIVELLSQLNIKPEDKLLIKSELFYQGKHYAFSWPLGYAIAWANGWSSA